MVPGRTVCWKNEIRFWCRTLIITLPEVWTINGAIGRVEESPADVPLLLWLSYSSCICFSCKKHINNGSPSQFLVQKLTSTIIKLTPSSVSHVCNMGSWASLPRPKIHSLMETESATRWTTHRSDRWNHRSPLDDLDVPRKIILAKLYRYDLAHFAGQEPYAYSSWANICLRWVGSVLYRSRTTAHNGRLYIGCRWSTIDR